ncbi:MAG: exopolysaccharide biosynthesis protein, partial [Pseudomonadota bacterium]
MQSQHDQDMAISERLDQLAENAPADTVTLSWVLDDLNERAFGLFLLFLALPCCIPFLYGVPQIVALPMMFVSVQILFGRRSPWLPEKLG